MRYVPEDIERYAERYTSSAHALFDRLAAETQATQDWPQMMVGPLEGAFLAFMVALKQPRRVLEIGTFTGWSSIAMASALPPGATLETCDVNSATTEIARRYAAEAGVADRVVYHVGPALDTLRGLDGPFDLVFLDADKARYVDYYEAVLPKLAAGGVILADNTLFGFDGNEHVERFNAHVRDDDRVECVLVTIREGVTLIRRRA